MMHHKAPHRHWQPSPRHLAMYDARQDSPSRDPFRRLRHAVPGGPRTADDDPPDDMEVDVRPEDGAAAGANDRRPEKALGASLRSQARSVPEREAAGRGPRPLEIPALHAGLSRLRRRRGRERRQRTGLSWTGPAWPKTTLVVYTSDQGFYLGEHGWFDKRFMYEESLRMPLVMRLSGHRQAGFGQRRPGQQPRFRPDVFSLGRASPRRGNAGRAVRRDPRTGTG